MQSGFVLKTINEELEEWMSKLDALTKATPKAAEDEIGGELVKQLSAERSKLLLPAFEKYKGSTGVSRFSCCFNARIPLDLRRGRDENIPVCKA